METKSIMLECGCCYEEEFTIREREFFKITEINFILNIFKAIRENPRKNPLRYIEGELTCLELKRLETLLKTLKGVIPKY